MVGCGCTRSVVLCESRVPISTAWIANPKRKVQTTVWDAVDGVRLSAVSLYFGPPVAKASDGKLWFHTGEGIQLVDPHHVAFNKVPPPVHIEQIVADNKVYWQNLRGKSFEPASAGANSRCSDRLLRSQPGGARRRSISNTCWRARIRTGGKWSTTARRNTRTFLPAITAFA